MGDLQNEGIETEVEEEKNNTEAQEIKSSEEEQTGVEGEMEETSSSVRENRTDAVPVISVQAASDSDGEEKEESDEVSDDQKSYAASRGISSPVRNTQNGEH